MLFKNNKGKKIVIGMIHLAPFPGTPQYVEGNLARLEEKVLKDAKALKDGGAHGGLLQTEDWVFENRDETDPVRVAAMSALISVVRHEMGPDFIIGCGMLWNGMVPALAAAKGAGADFVHGKVFLGEAPSPYGTVVGQPFKTMMYRKIIDAQNVDVVACLTEQFTGEQYDKHYLQDMAFEAMRMGADAIEISHPETEVNNRICRDIKEKGDFPILLHGGTEIEDCVKKLEFADAVLVGKAFENGERFGYVVEDCVKRYMEQVGNAYDIDLNLNSI